MLDSSENANHGTTSNPDWNSSGKFSSSLSFDLSNGRSVTHAGLSADYPSVTLSAWVYPAMKTFIFFQQIESEAFLDIGKKSSAFLIWGGISQSYLSCENEDEIHARGYLPLHQWTHLALSYDLNSRTVQLFFNGVNLISHPAFPPFDFSSFLSL